MDRLDDAACTQCKGGGTCRTCNGSGAQGEGRCPNCFEGMCNRCNGNGHDPDHWKAYKRSHGKNRVGRY